MGGNDSCSTRSVSTGSQLPRRLFRPVHAVKLDASVTGKKPRPGEPADKLAVFEPLNRAASGTVDGGYGAAGTGSHEHHGGKPTLQLLQPLLGYTEYDVVIRSLAAGSGKAGGTAAPIPTMEYRLTYVPTPFTYTQIGVRCFFTLTSGLLLLTYSIAMCSVRAPPIPPKPTPAPPPLLWSMGAPLRRMRVSRRCWTPSWPAVRTPSAVPRRIA
jgi:hypothetical protein